MSAQDVFGPPYAQPTSLKCCQDFKEGTRLVGKTMPKPGPDIDAHTQSLDSFHRFNDLPVELKLKIWDWYMVVSPQLLTIYYKHLSSNTEVVCVSDHLSILGSVPPTLHVDRTARKQALKQYTLISLNKQPRYFNFNSDVLHFQTPCAILLLYGELQCRATPSACHCRAPERRGERKAMQQALQASVQHVAFGEPLDGGHMPAIDTCLLFSQLKTVTIKLDQGLLPAGMAKIWWDVTGGTWKGMIRNFEKEIKESRALVPRIAVAQLGKSHEFTEVAENRKLSEWEKHVVEVMERTQKKYRVADLDFMIQY